MYCTACTAVNCTVRLLLLYIIYCSACAVHYVLLICDRSANERVKSEDVWGEGHWTPQCPIYHLINLLPYRSCRTRRRRRTYSCPDRRPPSSPWWAVAPGRDCRSGTRSSIWKLKKKLQYLFFLVKFCAYFQRSISEMMMMMMMMCTFRLRMMLIYPATMIMHGI